jgi:archaellum biogenesis protein FlaJ (TadC family)
MTVKGVTGPGLFFFLWKILNYLCAMCRGAYFKVQKECLSQLFKGIIAHSQKGMLRFISIVWRCLISETPRQDDIYILFQQVVYTFLYYTCISLLFTKTWEGLCLWKRIDYWLVLVWLCNLYTYVQEKYSKPGSRKPVHSKCWQIYCIPTDIVTCMVSPQSFQDKKKKK